MTTSPVPPASPGSREVPCAHCGAALPRLARFCGVCGERLIRDFFISYTHADEGWATWIAWQLEAAGYTTLIQAWDIRPGSNFLKEMDEAMQFTRRTLSVLSPDYLTSLYTAPEYGDALRRDPTGSQRLLVPVRVRAAKLQGWLAQVVYVDLLGLPADEAQRRLLEALQVEGRPTEAPAYPGTPMPAYPAVLVSLWQVPYQRNPYFTGREALLEQIRATFTNGGERVVTQAVSGLGGVGKTQTALEYAFRQQQSYQAVFWAQAETREQLLQDAGQLATFLELPERNEPDQARVVAGVRRWLEEHPGWLLVLDNVEELPVVRDLLPTRGQGHVLLTTRAQTLGGTIAGRARVEPLPIETAMQLLLRRAHLLLAEAPLAAADPEQQRLARTLVEELGRLPLALDQAGAYLDETGCGLADYLALYRTQRKVALSLRGESAAEDRGAHPEAVGATWAVSFQQVEQRSPAAVELLRLCAYLAPEGIPEPLITAGGEELPPALQTDVNDALQWNAALAALRRFSLLDRQAETETLSLHRLVQVVVQEALPPEERRAWAAYAVRLVNRAFPSPPEFANWGRCEQLLPHALVCAGHIEVWELTFTEAALLLYNAGWYLRDRARYAEALPLLQRVLAIYQQALGPTHPDVASSLNNLANLYHTQGQYAEALPLYQRALAIREQALGPAHPDVATSLNNLASLYRTQGQYAEALPLYQRALAIYQQALGPTHPDVATSLNNLANLNRDQGQYAEALPLYQRALAIWEQALGPNHPNMATSLNNLAGLYHTQGQYAEALPLYQRALAIREQALGPKHPHVAVSLFNLAGLYQDQGQYEEALPLYQRALAIDEQAYGPTHPEVATDLESLAALLRAMQQPAQAAELEARAQDIRATSR